MAARASSRDHVATTELYVGEWHIEPSRRVFVNRNLKMRNIHMVGFDMDYTLAGYDKHSLERLAYDATRDKLVQERAYPPAILALRYIPDFVIRGLVVDKGRGNLLKIDQYNYVTRAYHGTRLIPSAERKAMYRNSRIKLAGDKYVSIDTLFGLPEATLFCQLVDHFDLTEKVPYKDNARLYDDVRECIDRAHADDTIKREICRDPGRFVVRDPQLPATLAAFRAQGKKLFLLTNSEPYYTQIVMHYLLHDAGASQDWRDYFDLVVVSAQKPGFYANDRPFERLDDDELAAAGMRPGPVPVFRGGGARHLQELGGHGGDEVLYVGDHTFGDILRAKRSPGWRTAMLVEELKSEIEVDRALAGEYQAVDRMLSRRSQIVLEAGRLRRRMQQLAHRRVAGEGILAPADLTHLQQQELADALRIQALEAEVEAVTKAIKERRRTLDGRFNPYWGKLFKCGEINSRFGQQVRAFACLYTSAVSNFVAYPESMYFRSSREIMPHEMGLETS